MPTKRKHSASHASVAIDTDQQVANPRSPTAVATESLALSLPLSATPAPHTDCSATAHTNQPTIPQETETQPGAAQRDPASLAGPRSALTALATAPGPQSEAAFARAAKRNRRRKRVRMGAALRDAGVDEYMVAGTLGDIVDMLKTKTEANDKLKSLVDVLKECSKHLEEDSKLGSGPYVRVNLIHNVARPVRNPEPPGSVTSSTPSLTSAPDPVGAQHVADPA